MIRLALILATFLFLPLAARAQPPHAAATLQQPPPGFTDRPLYVPDSQPPPAGQSASPSPLPAGVSVGAFVSGLGSGFWEPAGGGAWTFHAGHRNVLTGQGTENILTFRPISPKEFTGGGGVAIVRAVQNDKEIPPAQIASTFGQAAVTARAPEATPIDLAQLAVGRTAHDIFGDTTLTERLRLLMGPAFFTAKSWSDIPTPPALAQGAYVTATACKTEACDSETARFVFDHTGHVWASLNRPPQPIAIYGEPPELVRRMLVP